jgi:NADPH:quinone reductase-like Zn-dependent oxidoreductase
VLAIHERADVQPGQRVLLNGAGGGAGTFALQLAKARGAEVTAVDNSSKVEFLRELGADHVVDYTKQDPMKTAARFDLILDINAHRSPLAFARVLARGGTYFVVGGGTRFLLQALAVGPVLRSKRVRVLVVPQGGKHLVAIADLCAGGAVAPVIDRCFPITEIADAMSYVGTDSQKGKVVITVS